MSSASNSTSPCFSIFPIKIVLYFSYFSAHVSINPGTLFSKYSCPVNDQPANLFFFPLGLCTNSSSSQYSTNLLIISIRCCTAEMQAQPSPRMYSYKASIDAQVGSSSRSDLLPKRYPTLNLCKTNNLPVLRTI